MSPTASEHDDVLLTTREGQCIRFSVTDVRVFKGRDSMGVRGIALAAKGRAQVISLAILTHFEAVGDERAAYLKRAGALRRGAGAARRSRKRASRRKRRRARSNSPTRASRRCRRAEQIILTVSENGYGKRTSSFEYRITGRGGKGIVAMAVNARNGALVASFPVEEGDEIMLVTDGGQLIRCPVDGIRIAGRGTQGVIVFDTAEDERVVSVEHIGEVGGEEEAGNGEV